VVHYAFSVCVSDRQDLGKKILVILYGLGTSVV
jgi:hypothetical protein